VYFALFDEVRRSVLLVDHVKAGLWLFLGGHVDDGEDPRTTVLREAAEELQIIASSTPRFGGEPLFPTVTQIEADPREASQVRWFNLDDPAEWAHDRFDPHMARFRDKLLARLDTPALIG
jgi:NADH pyrophosphatase NudC (nudix superfamily)